MPKDTIEIRGIDFRHPMAAVEFLAEVEKKWEEGYRVFNDGTLKGSAQIIPYPFCKMVKGEDDVVEEKPETPEPEVTKQEDRPSEDSESEKEEGKTNEDDKSPLDMIEAATKKNELLDIASALKIEVPEDMKYPKQIKQFLLNSVSE